MESGYRQKKGAVATAVEYNEGGKKMKSNTREEVERKIMLCLLKRFSLTNKCTLMSKKFVIQVGY